MANKFLTGITIATAVGGEYTFPIADGSANQAIVTDGNGNLSFGSAIASTAEDAQRLVCEMINNSGSTIGAFLPVCCVGIHSDGTPEIAPARSDNPLYMPAIGITQSSVGNNNRTDILLYGKLEDIDTTDYETGDTLYVAATGGWSTTRPTGNNLIQAVFKVGRIQQNNGSGGAFGAGKYEDLPNIGEGKVWIGDSSSYPVATSLSTAIPAALGYTPVTNARTLTINDVTYDLSADRSWTIEAGGSSASTRTIQKFTSTSNQTTFTITGGYTVGMVDVWVNGSKLDNAVDFTASNGTTVVLTDALTANQIVEVYKYGSQFIVNNGLRQKTLFTATAGQTSFTVAYSVGLVDVFYNGSKLDDSEFTATNGTSIVLGTACAVNDKVEVIAFSYNVNGFTGIGGSGTTNNLPKFTAAGTIGDSAITDNGTTVTLVSRALSGTSATFSGNMGIGNTSTDTFSGYSVLQVGGTNNGIIQTFDGSVKTALVSNATGFGLIGTRTNHSLNIITNDTTRLTIASTGAATFTESVNIANATANLSNQKLSVNGGIGVSGINLGNMTNIGGLGAGFMYLPISGGINFRSANGAIGYASIQADASSNILVSGSLGVGGTTPISMLHVSETTSGNFTAESRIGGNTSAFGVVTNFSQAAATFGSIYCSPGYSNGSITFKLGAGSGNTNQLVLKGDSTIGLNTTNTIYAQLNIKQTTSQLYGGIALYSNDGTESFLGIGNIGSAVGLFATYGASGSYLPITFSTGGSEKYRITATGQSTFQHTQTNQDVIYAMNGSASPYGMNITFTAASPNNTTNNFIYLADSSGLKCRIVSNGSIYNSTGTYGTISDAKFKENIVDATPKLSDILKLKVRNFNLIGDETKQIGFVAQEFEEVFPNMVDASKDKETGDEYKAIKTSVLIPILVKAIQELKAEIEQLKQK